MAKTPISPFGWEYINDLSVIPEENDSVDFLLHRVECGQIYTWVGPLLLAVNPGNDILNDLYDELHQNQYTKNIDMVLRNAPPHVYAIANRARYRLVQGLGKVSQVIVISGESGTGKTFNSRQILDFLAGIDKNAAKLKFPDGVENIAHEIGNVCPLVAAFSTASTKRNPSSSRHGQLVQLQYKGGSIMGACVHSFLLERTRVTEYSNNFDIFYQVISGLPNEELQPLGLSWHEKYVILGENHIHQKQKYHQDFLNTMKAMETLGFTKNCKNEILQVLALLLHMGNIKFRETTPENCILDTTDEESRRAVLNTCKLSALQEHELEELLTSTLICPRSTRRRHTMYRRDLRTSEACRHRLFSIIRWVYDRLFHSLVDRINHIISSKGDDCHWLGILDIFGFESFESNGIEQLCINYTTERLQLYFMEDYLENGQRELEEEGLSVIPPPPTMSIYRNRLGVIEQSLFSTMNDACQTPTPPSLSTVSQQLFMRQSNAREFLSAKSHSFIINHYSCPVEYDIDDILEKNSDKVPVELSTTFHQTNNSLLKALTNVSEDIFNDNGRVTPRKSTTLSKLKSSMDSLMQELEKCDTHYVKCVKPQRSGDSWLKEQFRKELVCSGIMDALPLAKCKFPIRLTYEEFSKRYYLPACSSDFRLQFEKALRNIVDAENITSLMHSGNKRIFITESLFFELERFRKEYRSASARKIADFWLEHKSKRLSKIDSSNVEEILGIGHPVDVLSKPAIIVTRPSLNAYEGDDEVFSGQKSSNTSAILNIDSEINNNNLEKKEFIPLIALNDLIIDHMSPMATGIPKIDSSEVPQGDKESLTLQQRRMRVNTAKNQARDVNLGEAGWRAKDLYVVEWLENISPPSDMAKDDIDMINQFCKESQGVLKEERTPKSPWRYAKFVKSSHEGIPVFDCFSKTEWSIDGSNSVIYLHGNERLFYRERVLSKRRLSEIPIRFHTKKTCLINSYCLPRCEIPRGLQDCLD